MCYKVRCSACGKSTWAGCGRHVRSVYQQIEEAQRCFCKEWPGISTTANTNTNTNTDGSDANNGVSANPSASLSSSSCNIL